MHLAGSQTRCLGGPGPLFPAKGDTKMPDNDLSAGRLGAGWIGACRMGAGRMGAGRLSAGRMGAAKAIRLARAGAPPAIWNRTRAKAEAA